MKLVAIGVFCLLGATAAQAQAQGVSAAEKGYVMGLGGVTFGTETAGIFGAEAGTRVGTNLIVFAEGGRMTNIAPKSLQDDLDEAADELEAITGEQWGFESKVPATYFGAGVKYLFPMTPVSNFYVAGSGGFARMKAEITEMDFGDVIDDLIDEGFLDEDDVEGTEFYFSLGGGLQGNLGTRAMFDVGYRFMRVSDANVSRLTAGIGFRF